MAIRPTSLLNLSLLADKQQEFVDASERTEEYGLIFDPEFTLGDESNKQYLYKDYTNEVNNILENDGLPNMSFDKTNYYINKKDDSRELSQYNQVHDFVNEVASDELAWGKDVPSKAREDLVIGWADRLYGVQKNVFDRLPLEDMSQEAIEDIDNLTDIYFNKVMAPTIKQSARMQLNEFRDPHMGFYQGLVNAPINYVEGMRSLATSPWTGLDDTGVEKGLENVSNSMKAYADKQRSASGVYGMSWADIAASDYESAIEQAKDIVIATVGHGMQSLPQQAPSLVATGVAMSPLGLTTKLALGGTALTLGGLAETGGMAQEMFGEFQDLRSRAKGLRPFVGESEGDDSEESKMATKDFNRKFMTPLGKTADLLSDDEVRSLADEAARTYGLFSTAVELGEFSFAGKIGVFNTKWNKWLSSNKSTAARIWVNDIIRGGISQGGEEVLQELGSEFIKSYTLPNHQIDFLQVAESGVLGSAFGMGIGSMTGYAKSRQEFGLTEMSGDAQERIKVARMTRDGSPLKPQLGSVVQDPDSDIITTKGGYDNALIVGYFSDPSTFINKVANAWEVPETEVNARWDAMMLDDKTDISLSTAKRYFKRDNNLKQIFPNLLDDNTDTVFDEEEVNIIDETGDDPTTTDWDPNNDYDPTVNDGLDLSGGMNEDATLGYEIEELKLKRKEIEDETDVSILSPQEKKSQLKDIDAQLENLTKKRSSGPTALKTKRNTNVKRQQTIKANDKKSNLIKGILEIDDTADAGMLKQLPMKDLEEEAKAYLGNASDPYSTRLGAMLLPKQEKKGIPAKVQEENNKKLLKKKDKTLDEKFDDLMVYEEVDRRILKIKTLEGYSPGVEEMFEIEDEVRKELSDESAILSLKAKISESKAQALKPFNKRIIKTLEDATMNANELADALDFPRDKIDFHIDRLLENDLIYEIKDKTGESNYAPMGYVVDTDGDNFGEIVKQKRLEDRAVAGDIAEIEIGESSPEIKKAIKKEDQAKKEWRDAREERHQIDDKASAEGREVGYDMGDAEWDAAIEKEQNAKEKYKLAQEKTLKVLQKRETEDQVELFEEQDGETVKAISLDLGAFKGKGKKGKGKSILQRNKESMRTDVTEKDIDKSDIAKTGRNAIGKISNDMNDPTMDDDVVSEKREEGQGPKIEYKGKALKKIESHFETLWSAFKRKHNYTEAQFEAWANSMGKFMERFPYTENFRLWSEKRKNKGFVKRVVASVQRTGNESFTNQLMEQFMEELPYLVDKESESYTEWSEPEDTAISVKEFRKIANTFFVKYGFRDLSNAKIQKINRHALKLIRDGVDNPFQQWVTNISDADNLANRNGWTIEELLSKSNTAEQALRKYWTMLHPDNTGTIHRGRNGDIVQWEAKVNGSGREGDHSMTMNSDKPGFFIFRPTNIKIPSLNKNPHATVATKRMISRHNQSGFKYSILSGSDLVHMKWNQKRYKFLHPREIVRLYQEQLVPKGLVPISTRGEQGRLIMVDQPKYAMDIAKDVNLLQDYLNESIAEYNDYDIDIDVVKTHFSPLAGTEYLSEQEKQFLTYAFNGNYTKYKTHWITRHDVLKELFSPEYITMSLEKLARRIKVPFTPVFTSEELGPRRKLYFNPKGAKYQVYNELTNELISSNDLTKTLDGELQYIGDGQLLTSEVVFKEDYTKLGNSKDSVRAKTIHYTNQDYNIDLSKMDEKALTLDSNRYAMVVDASGNPIFTVRRDRKGYVNLYEPGNAVDGSHIHYVATNDEAKIRTGVYKEDNVVLELPSNAIGMIRYTGEQIKNTGMLSTQISYYIDDPEFQKQMINHYVNDDSSPFSPRNLTQKLIDGQESPETINDLILKFSSDYIDVMPDNITNLGELGVGYFPSGLTFLREVLKNKYLKNIADFRTDGSYLDFRADYEGNVKENEIIMPYNPKDAKGVLEKMGKSKGDYNSFEDMLDDINNWLSRNSFEISMIVGRSPLVSKSGYGMYELKELRTDIGDTFIVHPKEVKERHNGDHDNDHGHIARLPKDVADLLRPYIVGADPLNMGEFLKGEMEGQNSVRFLSDQTRMMGSMTYGETAIGEIVNTTRIAASMSQMFTDAGFMVFNDKGTEVRIKIRNMTDKVNNPLMQTESGGWSGTLGQMLGRYTQAALDHPQLLLLNRWNYDVRELRKMIFYDPDNMSGTISDEVFNTIRDTIIQPILSLNNIVDNMQEAGAGSVKFNDVFDASTRYHNFMKDREGSIMKSMQVLAESDGFDEAPYAVLTDVSVIADENPASLQEVVTSWFSRLLNASGKSLDNFYNISEGLVKRIHNKVVRDMFNEIEAGGLITAEAEKNPQDEMNQAYKYAQSMSNSLHSMINKIENVGTASEPAFIDIVTPKAWDHNDDFINFQRAWSNSFNKLSEFQQQIATAYYFYGTVINNSATGQKQVRKSLSQLPPVSTKMESTTMHPEIVREYFKRFNKEYKKNANDKTYKNELSKVKPVNAIQVLKKRYCK